MNRENCVSVTSPSQDGLHDPLPFTQQFRQPPEGEHYQLVLSVRRPQAKVSGSASRQVWTQGTYSR
jgi:hypothetical protein